ncbi:MAG: exonuclease [Oligoflexia bacterium]|nr:exonuclease [Oligoflexia bacterium]
MTQLWKEQTFIGFDTETTGKYPLAAEVVEVAAVKWRSGKIVDKFESFVRPKEKMSDFIIGIHKITNEMVENAPLAKEVLPKFLEFIKDGILIAHHAPFDMGFISAELEKLNLNLPTNKVICTSLLSRKLFPHTLNHRLATLVEYFGIKVVHAHRALEDSKACLEIALKCMEKVGESATMELIYQAQGGALEWSNYSVKDLNENPQYSALVEASQKKLLTEIVYEGGSNPGKPRNIIPQGIVRNPQGDYVVGFDNSDQKEKRYYLNRIKSSKILD